MACGALNTVTTADVEHAWEDISDVSYVGLWNWERQSLTCHFFSKFSPFYAIHFRCCFIHLLKIALDQSWLYCEAMFAVAERNSRWDEESAAL